jgi:hypothetical protein
MTGPFPDLKERGCIFFELTASRGELSTISISNEKLATKGFFKRLDPGADSGLRDIETFSGFPKASGIDDLKEGSRSVDIHAAFPFKQKICLSLPF